MSDRSPALAATPLAILTGRPGRHDRLLRLGLFAGWLLAAGFLVTQHVVWRDEVRALTLALTGDTTWDMLRAIHGEGHPAIWYLMLRGGYALTGTKLVLPAVAFGVAITTAALVAWRAPFRPAVLALVLFSAFALVDYAVIARNYGISMLLMAVIAERYGRARDTGITLGLLLFLLCNTNAPSVLLAGGIILFRGIELWSEQGWRWTPAARQYAINTGIAALGVLACAATIYPPYNDAASLAAGTEPLLPLSRLAGGLGETVPGMGFFYLILLGSLAGLCRAPAALAASVTVTLGAALFFYLVYPGMYRHQALVLVFLLGMYWLVLEGRGGRWPDAIEARWVGWFATAQRYGAGAFAGLLALQTLSGLALAVRSVRDQPFSRSRDLSVLLHQPALQRAVVIADPDVLLEPLSYYAPNPTYFVRERRWGRVVAFTKAAMREVTLGELLATARSLHMTTARPVVILLDKPLDPQAPAYRHERGYLGSSTATPEQVRAFLAGTRVLARFGPAQTDESYTVYLLR